MAYSQQQYDYQQARPHQHNLFTSLGYTHSPSESVVGFDYMHQGPTTQPYQTGFTGSIEQQYHQQPYSRPAQHQQQHPNAYQSPYAPRRGSYVGHANSTGPLSPTNSLFTPPGTNWNSPPNYGRHAGSPSVTRWSNSSHTTHPGYGSRSSTPFNGHGQMNAAAPAFTPHFSTHEGSFSTSNGQHFDPPALPLQADPSSPSERKAPVPRLHRTAPSISLSTLNRPIPPSAHSPLMSRGVSPVGSSFSNGADGSPLLNSFGLPINEPRTYKVLLPFESEELRPEETRKRSLWKRRPLEEDINVTESIADETMLAEFRSKSPHPEEMYGPWELPDNIEIYLPNDWVTLRQALFEDRMAKIGITRDYISNIHSLLDQKALPSGNTAFPKPPVRPHLRSESVFAAPFVPRWQPPTSKAEETETAPVHLPSTRGHGASMSMAVPSHPNGFMRQHPPFGPRGPVQSSRIVSDRPPMPAFGLAPALEEDEEEVEERKDEAQENESKDEGIAVKGSPEGRLPELSKSAKDLSLKELFAGFGISSELDSASVPNTPNHIGTTDTKALPLANGPLLSLTHERVAIEGATGYMSMPTSASLDESMEDHANMLSVKPEPRKSLSAPNLQQKSAEASRMSKSQQNASTTVPQTTDGDESDVEFDGATEYSNPSDEERAKQRRDRTLPAASPLAIPNSETWFEHSEEARARNDPSDEATLASRRPSWLDKESVRIPGVAGTISPGHAQHASFATAVSSDVQGRPRSLNADAPPFVLGFRLSPRDLGSTSSISSFNYEASKPPTTVKDEGGQEKKVWNVKAPEFKPSFQLLGDSCTSALEIKPHGLKHLHKASDQPHTASTSRSTEWEDTPTLVRTLGDAKSAVDSWLTDLTHPDQSATLAHHSTPLKSETDAHDSDTMRPRSNMRTFKFPPSPPPRSLPLEGPSTIARAPQLPPIGTIGRNTFKNVLNGFTFDGDRATPLRESHQDHPASRYRLPIPNFEARAIKEEPPSPKCSSLKASITLEKQTPVASADDQAGTGDESSSYNVKLESDDEGNLLDFAALPVPFLQEDQHEHVDPSSNESDDSSVPSSIIRAMHSTGLPHASLSQTWGTFEALLDRKLDGFHARISSQRESSSTQTWSPEAKENFVNTLRNVIREEFPRPLDQSEPSTSSVSPRERILLDAIQQTQHMINNVQQQHSLFSSNVFSRDHAAPSYSWGVGMHHDSEMIDGIAAPIVEAIRKSPATAFDFGQLESRIASMLEAQIQTLLTSIQTDQHTSQLELLAGRVYDTEELEGRLRQTVAHQISESILSTVPPLLLSALPTLVPLPSSPRESSATEGYVDLRKDLKAALRQLEQYGQSIKTDMAGNIETIHLQKEIIHLSARCERLSVENESQRDALEVSRQQYTMDFGDLRETIAVKDKQLDALRDELLRRATIMDQEAREKEKAHTAETTGLQVTLAGLQTELAILKQQARDSLSVQESLQKQLAYEKERNHNVDLERRAEIAIAQEREAAGQSLHAAQEQREQEHLRQINTLQEILSAEARSRIQLEDRVATAQDETRAARQQVAELQTQVTRVRASETSYMTQLTAVRETSEKAEQALKAVTAENAAYSQTLGHMETRLAEAISQSHKMALEQLLMQCSDVIHQVGSLVAFETVFATGPEPLKTGEQVFASGLYSDPKRATEILSCATVTIEDGWWRQESLQ